MKKIMSLFLMSMLLLVSVPAVFAAEKPDLELNSISTSSVSQTGEVAVVSALIRNLRDAKTGPFNVTISISPSSYKLVGGSLTQQFQGLGSGDGTSSSIKVAFNELRIYTITATVDPDKSVSETNENNNYVKTDIVVGWSFELREGEAVEVVSGGKEYKVEFSDLSGSKASFKVNGEVISLTTGTKTSLSDGTLFALSGLQYGNAILYMPKVTAVNRVASSAPQELPGQDDAKEVPVPEEYKSYESCILDVAELKTRILEYEKAGKEVPEDLWEKVDAVQKECDRLDLQQPPVKHIPEEEDCIGCRRNSACLQYGLRLVGDDGDALYCDIDGKFKGQKITGEVCQNDYECGSNTCSKYCRSFDEDVEGVGVEKRLKALEEEQKEQRNLLMRIISWIFGGFFRS